jgi:hypothetical protein
MAWQPSIQGTLNGHPLVHFDGSQWLEVIANPSLLWGTENFLIEIVAQLSGTNVENLYQCTEPSKALGFNFRTRYIQVDRRPLAGFFVLPGDEMNQLVSIESISGRLDDGVARLYTLARTGTGASTAIEVAVNGAVETSVTGAQYAFDVSPTTGQTYAPQIGQLLHGEIAEIVLVRGPTSSPNRTAIETYMKSKYGL